MTKRLAVTTLPPDILTNLRRRLVDSNFGRYEEHSEWLRSQGHPISKSAIHRYATEYATSLMAAKGGESCPSVPEVRLRCLEVASSMGEVDRPDELIERAESLLRWVYSY